MNNPIPSASLRPRQHLPLQAAVLSELVHALESSEAEFLVHASADHGPQSVCRLAFLAECRAHQYRLQRAITPQG